MTTFEDILSLTYVDGFEEFGSTFSLIVMFRRVVFFLILSLGIYPLFFILFFPFLIISTWCYATGGIFCSWGLLVRSTSFL